MNLNPALDRIDRIGSLVVGVGLFAYAYLGEFDKIWLQGLCAGFGLAFAVGGIGGT